jgi:molecular chaperone HscB
MQTHSCWHCGQTREESLFCRYCNTLQAPTPDYYRFLGLERKLHVDPQDLQNRFYTLSRQVHPDRFTRRSPNEKQFSLEATAILNDAYRVLRDPISRAEYILKEQGFDIGEQRSNDVPPELLEEVFELNMALEEMRGGDASATPQLREAHQRFEGLRGGIDGELEQLFQEYDATGNREVLARIRRVLNRRRYIQNLLREVEKELVA